MSTYYIFLSDVCCHIEVDGMPSTEILIGGVVELAMLIAHRNSDFLEIVIMKGCEVSGSTNVVQKSKVHDSEVFVATWQKQAQTQRGPRTKPHFQAQHGMSGPRVRAVSGRASHDSSTSCCSCAVHQQRGHYQSGETLHMRETMFAV